MMSMYFTMNIVTAGWGDMFGVSDTERIVTCIIIVTGDALFAVAFGKMASIATSKASDITNFLKTIEQSE